MVCAYSRVGFFLFFFCFIYDCIEIMYLSWNYFCSRYIPLFSMMEVLYTDFSWFMYHRSGHVFQCPCLKQIMIYVAPVLDQSGFKFLIIYRIDFNAWSKWVYTSTYRSAAMVVLYCLDYKNFSMGHRVDIKFFSIQSSIIDTC